MSSTLTILDEARLLCLTCGQSPDEGRGLVVHSDAKWNEHGHTDSAHLPNWTPENYTGWELADVADLAEGDELGTGEIVRTVTHADWDDFERWPPYEDGQSRMVTDRRPDVRVGWPGGSKILRRILPESAAPATDSSPAESAG